MMVLELLLGLSDDQVKEDFLLTGANLTQENPDQIFEGIADMGGIDGIVKRMERPTEDISIIWD